MFEWLSRELASIQTPRFHVVDGTVDPKLRSAVASSSLALPGSYQDFVLEFGNAKLYRQSRSGYTIGVFAAPRSAKPGDLAEIYQIGFHNSRAIYVGCSAWDSDWPVYRGGKGPARKVAGDFHEWLVAACDAARNSYPPDKWAQIMRGPARFSQDEEHIIAARRRFEWRVLEIDQSGDRVIEVKNGSDRLLPVLTIGVRSRDGRLNGAIRLKVGHVHPGQTDVLRSPCYKDLFRPEEIELFSLPDPQPEDREYYPEFGTT